MFVSCFHFCNMIHWSRRSLRRRDCGAIVELLLARFSRWWVEFSSSSLFLKKTSAQGFSYGIVPSNEIIKARFNSKPQLPSAPALYLAEDACLRPCTISMQWNIFRIVLSLVLSNSIPDDEAKHRTSWFNTTWQWSANLIHRFHIWVSQQAWARFNSPSTISSRHSVLKPMLDLEVPSGRLKINKLHK